jgi:hypothetical protein
VPKLKLSGNVGIEAAKIDAVEGFSDYDGEVPPGGTYPSSVIAIKVGTSSTKKPMLTVFSKIDAPKNDPKKRDRYNGYLMSDFLVIPEDKNYEHYGLQVGQINRLLDALSGDDMEARKKFWSGNAVTSADGKKLESIGPIKIKGGVKVMIAAKADSYKRKEKDEDGNEELVTVKTLRVNDYFPRPKAAGEVEEAPAEEGSSEDDYTDADEVEYEDAEEGEEADESSFVDDSEDQGDADDEADFDGDSADTDDESDGSDSDDADDADESGDADGVDPDEADGDDGAEEADADDGDIEGVASEVSVDTDDGEVPAKEAPRKRRSAF